MCCLSPDTRRVLLFHEIDIEFPRKRGYRMNKMEGSSGISDATPKDEILILSRFQS